MTTNVFCILDAGTESSVKALSISSCSLADRDLSGVCSAIAAGLSLHMLKLSANRLTDKGVNDLVTSLLSNQSHQLKLIDMSNNRVSIPSMHSFCIFLVISFLK